MDSTSEYGCLKLPDLKEKLRRRGLIVSGNKGDLVSRLEAYDAALLAARQSTEDEGAGVGVAAGSSQSLSRKRKEDERDGGPVERSAVDGGAVDGADGADGDDDDAPADQDGSAPDDAKHVAEEYRPPSIGEQVIFNKLLRDQSLSHFNPRKLSDVQHVIELRCYGGLLSDIDLKECWFQRLHGFEEKDFVLANWRQLTLGEIKQRVIDVAHTHLQPNPAARKRLDAMRSKKAIMREYGMLAIVPWQVYRQTRLGLEVLQHIRSESGRQLLRQTTPFLEGRRRAEIYLGYACISALDEEVIVQLIDEFGANDLARACRFAAMSDHKEVIDFLVERYDADVHAGCLHNAASHGYVGLIQHLVDMYKVDPCARHYKDGGSALHYAADRGNVEAIKYLVEKHHVDVNIRDNYGETALIVARRYRFTECTCLSRLPCSFARSLTRLLFVRQARRCSAPTWA